MPKETRHFGDMQYLDERRVTLTYELPLAEIVYDFFDILKSSTKGYASFDYELIGYKPSKLVKMDILLNGEKSTLYRLSSIATQHTIAEKLSLKS